MKQFGTVEEYIIYFEKFSFWTKGISDTFFYECFISGLKDNIQAHVLIGYVKKIIGI